MVEASLRFFPMDDVIEPFPINFIDINDRFRTTVGFTFFYSGIEPNLDSEIIDNILRQIYDHNKLNPLIPDNENVCPVLNEYKHHIESASILIFYDDDFVNNDTMTIFRFQVLFNNKKFTFAPNKLQYNADFYSSIVFENNDLKPLYLLKYADNLAIQIDKTLKWNNVEKNSDCDSN